MSYAIVIHGLNGRKPISRMIYPTKHEAKIECRRLNLHKTGKFSVIDIDHEPGRSIMKRASPG